MSADNAAPKGNNRLIWQIITGLILGSIIGQIAHSAQSGFMNSVIGITGIFGSLFVGALKGIAPFLVRPRRFFPPLRAARGRIRLPRPG